GGCYPRPDTPGGARTGSWTPDGLLDARHRGYGAGRDPGGRGRHWQIASGPGAQRTRRWRGPSVAGMPRIALLSAYCPLPPHRAVGTASAAPGARGDCRAEGAATGGVLKTAGPVASRDRAAVCSPPVPPVACHLCSPARAARAAAAADLARAPGAPTTPGCRAAPPPDHGRPALGRSLHAGVAQPPGGSGPDRPHSGPVHLSAGLPSAVDGALASHPDDTGPLAPAPGHRADAPGRAGQGTASGGGGADCGQDRWGAPVCGGVNQDGSGIRSAPGARGSLP